jgi:anaerobic magnesium-protoporphyrin IX monomethyl ester cyclase
MKVLLVNPPWWNKPKSLWSGISGVLPPLGLGYLASMLLKNNIDAEILDLNAFQQPPEAVADFLKGKKYDWVGITATTNLVPSAKKLAQAVRANAPESKILMGGVHPTLLPDEIMAWPEVDYVIRGEGEHSIVELVSGKAPEGIRGLSFRKGKEIVHNSDRELIPDLDQVPFPAWHLLPIKKYLPALGGYKKLPAVSLITSRGCSGSCTYCNNFFGSRVRKRSADNVVAELAMLVKDYGIREVYFYDDSFTEFPSKVIDLCKKMVSEKLNLSWSCFARVNIVSEDLLRAMKEAGCHHISYGIESGNPEILECIDKKVNLEKVRQSVALTKKVGIDTLLGFMLGLPGETRETMEQSLRFGLELDPDMIIFDITTPFPGTKLFAWAEQNGYLKTKKWDEYDLYTMVMNLPTVSEQEVRDFYSRAYREFYFRLGYLLKRFSKMRTWLDFKQNLQAFMIMLKV